MDDLKLYLLERNDWDYDETVSLVVLARNDNEARIVAATWMALPEHPEIMPDIPNEYEGVIKELLDPTMSTCKLIEADEAKFVHRHIHHG